MNDMGPTALEVLTPGRPAAPAPVRRTAILVVGMHRSGTSALTRLLNLVGCGAARAVMEGDRFNERGYWESADVAALNDDLLGLGGVAWNDWAALDAAWQASPARPDLDARADRLLGDHFADQSLFVLKDPRLCRLLPFWMEALNRFNCDVRVVMPIRHPVEVGASLLKRNGLNPSLAQLAWLRHVLEAERDSRGLGRAFVLYDDLLQNWRGALRRVGEEIGVVWPALTGEAEQAADAFLSSSLRHHSRTEEDSLPQAAALRAPALDEVFSILAAGARGNDDLGRLDVRLRELDAASDLLRPPVDEIQAHARRLKERLDASAAQAESLVAELGQGRAREEQGRAREEGLGARLAAATAEVATLTADAERAAAREEGLRTRVAALEKQEKEARDQGLALQLVLSELRAVQRATADEAEELLAGYLKLRRQLGRRRQEVDRLAAELAAERRALGEIQRSASWRVTSPYRRIRGWLA